MLQTCQIWHEANTKDKIEQDTVCVANTIKVCKAKLIKKDNLMWKMNLFNDEGHPNWNKLLTYRLYKSDLETELYVKLAIQRDHLPIFAMFRCGNLPLNICLT